MKIGQPKVNDGTIKVQAQHEIVQVVSIVMKLKLYLHVFHMYPTSHIRPHDLPPCVVQLRHRRHRQTWPEIIETFFGYQHRCPLGSLSSAHFALVRLRTDRSRRLTCVWSRVPNGNGSRSKRPGVRSDGRQGLEGKTGSRCGGAHVLVCCRGQQRVVDRPWLGR